ncbi:hypothetical protein PspTeo4_31160 [Pseudomonas sp. Teo4]|nr:hypothetical protein [Pseudomonas sp. Teo4]
MSKHCFILKEIEVHRLDDTAGLHLNLNKGDQIAVPVDGEPEQHNILRKLYLIAEDSYLYYLGYY